MYVLFVHFRTNFILLISTFYVILLYRGKIMEKNYYDILEISKNASPEVIEKAYKALVKKYHPDLQSEISKEDAESKMKELNEAYETISNPEKRQIYDQKLEYIEKQQTQTQSKTQEQEQTPASSQTNPLYQQELQKQAILQAKLQEEQAIRQVQYEQQMTNAINKAYHDAYVQDLKNRGYKIKYKKTFKDYIRIFITIILTIVILFLIFQIPFVKNYFIKLYEENEIIQTIINIIIK